VPSEPAQPIERKLAAIFAADVAGYSRLMGQDEAGTMRALTAHREVMDRLIAQHRGRIAYTAGDSVLAEFPSVVDAVQCAVEVQKAVHEANEGAPEDRRMRFRVGIHVGDVMVRGGDLLGDGVNIAARLQELAPAGGLCISAEAHQYARRTLPLEFTDMGEQSVKNVGALRTYEVRRIGEHAYEPNPGTTKPFPLPDKPSIAVLPFINLSGPDDEYFCDGIVEEIVTALSRVKSFFVIARNSSFTYKGRTVDVKQVGRDLGVRYILEGSVRRARDRLRISGQLVDAIQGTHIWADRYDGSVEEIFELQDQITSRVVGAIEPKLKQHEIERSRQKPTQNLAAYDLYLKASWQLALLTRDGNEEALRLCREARKLDPLYARALALEAWCYLWSRRAEGWVENVSEEAREGVRLFALSRFAVDHARPDGRDLKRTMREIILDTETGRPF
jgi:adenylate cyclase